MVRVLRRVQKKGLRSSSEKLDAGILKYSQHMLIDTYLYTFMLNILIKIYKYKVAPNKNKVTKL